MPMASRQFKILILLLVAFAVAVSEVVAQESVGETEEFEGKAIVPEAKNWGQWAKGLLQNIPQVDSGPVAMEPVAKFPLILAEDRTRRHDFLNKFRLYVGGWDITNKHYWSSVAFTGVSGFSFAAIWFLCFGATLSLHFCRKWRGKAKERELSSAWLALLILFTCAASTGCILLTVGQNKFNSEAIETLNFVANQSDFTVQTLKNVTDFLSFARTINVGPVNLPSDVQQQIDKVKGDLTDAAGTISQKTQENYRRIRLVIGDVRHMLIVVASLMLVLALLGFLFSVCGHRHAIYIFVISGWFLVTMTFLLFGVFVIIQSAAEDTCTAMDEWVRYPQAETALSNLLPCVDERITNQTLYQSKEVVVQMVKIVNRVISSIGRSQNQSGSGSHHRRKYKPPLPYLCSPYDTDLRDRECKSREVPIGNASLVWQNYTCTDSGARSCSYKHTTVDPIIYNQLVVAANVSYALYYYTPLLLNLQDCKFVRDTFNSITTQYCPNLDRNLKLVCAGLALISTGVLLCLVLWVFYANRPRRVEEFVP
ncbi:hypothetical protein LUZ61_004478 [Rhynchospora tenuis]|uniref:Uncharacterized protein n=1 Tax=Rhynchospora tenuis TaxID=198213 RepID=A0AAD5ZMX9_9POAL|nr:hypothetical protein LUZ61_004478 [Rhynchospora tenuis]